MMTARQKVVGVVLAGNLHLGTHLHVVPRHTKKKEQHFQNTQETKQSSGSDGFGLKFVQGEL